MIKKRIPVFKQIIQRFADFSEHGTPLKSECVTTQSSGPTSELWILKSGAVGPENLHFNMFPGGLTLWTWGCSQQPHWNSVILTFNILSSSDT